jgi:hypothetical protein
MRGITHEGDAAGVACDANRAQRANAGIDVSAGREKRSGDAGIGGWSADDGRRDDEPRLLFVVSAQFENAQTLACCRLRKSLKQIW